MPKLLELSGRHQQLAQLSVEDFHRVSELGIYGKRAELIRGVVFEKPPMSPLHQKLSKRLYDHFLRLRLVGYSIRHESPLSLSDSEPLPDVAVVAGVDSDFDEAHPVTAQLVVEVAVSSELPDREMVAVYAEAEVKEYWIVLAVRQQIEVYRRPSGGVYTEKETISGGQEAICAAVPEIRVPVSTLFA